MTSWTSYPKIYNLGHPAADGILDGPVRVEEKVDGSQFSFGVHDGELRCKSKNREFDPHGPDSMFALAAVTARELAPLLQPGWTYRGEYLQKPKHNALAYDRAPTRHVMLFDVATGPERYLNRCELEQEAARIGLEVVPVLVIGKFTAAELLEMVDRPSVLGGQRAEGIVVKSLDRFGRDGKPLYAKYVTEAFREVKDSEWSKANPTRGDMRATILERYCSEARWRKAVEHLRDAGGLERAPQDIGKLMREVQDDVSAECQEEVKELLWQWVKKDLMRAATRGLPEWYKEKLALGEIG